MVVGAKTRSYCTGRAGVVLMWYPYTFSVLPCEDEYRPITFEDSFAVEEACDVYPY